MNTANHPDSIEQPTGRGKHLILTFAITAGVIGLSYGAWYSLKPAEAASTAPVPVGEVVVVPIEGMSCSACVARVKSTLKKIDGVGDVHVSLEHREAEIRYDPVKVSPETLAQAIKELGYTAGLPREEKLNP
tara:strand:- start:69 stop:464 length:396 start_codon:yes stop_codon:yes gene_type:complete